ncbi:MAG TPA: hypothetical protein ENI49_01385 [Thermoplasmatales archaeon]|nr:hypothetical protein [Thermoplasmatales archaeon]
MRGQKISTLFVIFTVLSFIFVVLSVANPIPRTVSGYVYVNGVVTKPDKVTLSIGTQQVTATLFNDGYYIIDFSEDDGETGTFTVTVDGKDYLAPETVTLLQDVYVYHINLTVDIPSANHPPSKPSNPSPADESIDVSVNIDISWYCSDPDGDPLTFDVYFGTDSNPPKVSSNQTSLSYSPDNMQYLTTYYWKIVVWDDRGAKNESDLWNFTTELFVNHPPDKPSNPSPANNSKNISINPTLSVLVTDPDDDLLDVYFYNALDDSFIGVVDNVSNGSTAAIQWNGLDYNQTYFWYVIVNDSEFEAKSDTWNFKTIHEENQPPHVEIIKPVDAIYFRDRQITKFFLPIIVGKITIEANATDSDGTIERVEFIVDNVSRYNDTTEPYSWLWDERIFGFHTITVVAHDNDGRATEISKSILIINLHR